MKVIPWNYGSTAYLDEKMQEEKPFEIQEPISNITGMGGMTRSDRVFASTPPPEKNNLEAAAKNKGKQVVNAGHGQIFPQGKSTSDDVEEFLRIIKRSDYKVVDHINKTPSKISILSTKLLQCNSRTRRDYCESV